MKPIYRNVEIIPVTQDNFEETVGSMFENTDVRLGKIFNEYHEEIDGFSELKRIKDDSFIAIVSNSYEITQHNDYIKPFIKKFLDSPENEITVMKENYQRKNRMACTIKSSSIIVNGEVYHKMVLLSNASDTSAKKKIIAGLLRKACLNMQFSGTPIAVGTTKHIKSSCETLEEDVFVSLAEMIDDEINVVIKLIDVISKIEIMDEEKRFLKYLYSNDIIPKKLITDTANFFINKGYQIPAADVKRYLAPETLFDIYQLIAFWYSNLIYQTDIIRGVNTCKQVHEYFIKYLERQGLWFDSKQEF